MADRELEEGRVPNTNYFNKIKEKINELND